MVCLARMSLALLKSPRPVRIMPRPRPGGEPPGTDRWLKSASPLSRYFQPSDGFLGRGREEPQRHRDTEVASYSCAVTADGSSKMKCFSFCFLNPSRSHS